MSAMQSGSIHLRRKSDRYWRVTFDIPALNILGPANIPHRGCEGEVERLHA